MPGAGSRSRAPSGRAACTSRTRSAATQSGAASGPRPHERPARRSRMRVASGSVCAGAGSRGKGEVPPSSACSGAGSGRPAPSGGRGTRSAPHISRSVKKPSMTRASCSGVGGVGVRPRLRPDPLDGLRIEPPEVGRARRVEPAPRRYRPRAALLERGIVEERVRLRVEDLVREGRGLRQVASVHRDLAPLDAFEEGRRDRRRPSPRAGRRGWSGARGGGPGSRALRPGSRRTRSGRGTRPRRGPRPASAGPGPAPCARPPGAEPRAIRSRSAPAYVEEGGRRAGPGPARPRGRAREVSRHLRERESCGSHRARGRCCPRSPPPGARS